jgi:hypothetical protein
LGAPIVSVQRRLAAAERVRVATEMTLLCAAPILWVLLAVVGGQAFFGIDVVTAFGMPWIVANLACSALSLGLGVAFVRPLRAAIAGKTLADVNARLADLAAFAEAA